MHYRLLVTLLLFTISVQAQRERYEHNSSWNTLSIKMDVKERLFVRSEFNFRRTNFIKDWEQIVLRPSIEYRLDKSITAATGYSYIKNYSYSNFSTPLDFKENNLWQQLFIQHSINQFEISHRLRFEERFRETIDSTDNRHIISKTDYSGRLRYRLIITIPLFSADNISVLAYDEVFLDFQKRFQPQKIDQNWIFLGLRFRESEHITISSGFHRINIPRENSSITNNIWETSITYTL
ncbi:hypothetical protein BST86_01860 [Nonlabens agnitus]|uniref:DUF2490 domain-containing protein n=2 Tax=Nonlabens agnitus TaxID=870484 RepID=A0A2S9WR02_9FLAO|nr:hypothetical protein BST86_01860 [Nonlabens agnitus]